MSPAPVAPVIDEASAALVRPGMSICVAGRNAENIPSMSRALGCRLSEDRLWLTVFLSPRTAADLLTDLRDNGAIAVAVVRPSTHQAIQFKGQATRIEDATDADRGYITTCSDGFAVELTLSGYTEAFARALMPPTVEDCVAVTFAPEAAFVQTPGKNAGKPLTGAGA